MRNGRFQTINSRRSKNGFFFYTHPHKMSKLGLISRPRDLIFLLVNHNSCVSKIVTFVMITIETLKIFLRFALEDLVQFMLQNGKTLDRNSQLRNLPEVLRKKKLLMRLGISLYKLLIWLILNSLIFSRLK